MLITDEYRKQLKEMHAGISGFGTCGHRRLNLVNKYIKKYKPKTILDYGCGDGSLSRYVDIQNIHWSNYDPAVNGYDSLPVSSDMVLCLDVLEHIEKDCLNDVLMHIRSLVKKTLICIIALGPSNKILPDERNAHITLMKRGEWLDMIRDAQFKITDIPWIKGKKICVIAEPI